VFRPRVPFSLIDRLVTCRLNERSRPPPTWPSAAPKQTDFLLPIHSYYRSLSSTPPSNTHTPLPFSTWHTQIIPGIPGVSTCVLTFPTYRLIAVQKHSPWVILNDFGGAFAMGAVGGGIWHGIKGARNSPRVCCLICLFRGVIWR
jgi:hypothetical protein